ncbi:MAG: ABC transporter ATP-binding protein [Gemmatimonadaceae bacterium]|nr:ABC transporter ATP-binding protein [Gemmatimonadaceae bacterium]
MSHVANGWSLAEVHVRHRRADRDVLDGVTLDVPPGRVTAVVGPNGAGKTTLAKLCTGLVAVQRGRASFDGRALAEWSPRDFAQRVAVVPQLETVAFPITVERYVALGRLPHLGAWASMGAEDRRLVASALECCGLEAFAARSMDRLSGGERQRARIARALAQDARALVLDEPSTALDLRHAMELFGLARGFADRGGAVLLITHDVNAAARVADTLAVLDRGRLRAAGAPVDVMRADFLADVFGWPVHLVPVDEAHGTIPQMLPVLRGAHADARDPSAPPRSVSPP